MPQDYVGKTFGEWTREDAAAAIDDAIEQQLGEDAYEANHAIVEEGDHWRDGEGWVGPRSPEEVVWKEQKKGIERQFTPVDKIAECLDRIANSLLKQEPDVDFAALEPAEPGSDAEAEQQKLAEEMRAYVSSWWDSKKLWELARQVVKRARWSGRGSLRAWIAPGNLETTKTTEGVTTRLPSNLDFAEALDRIDLSAPEPKAAYVYVDPVTRRRAAIYHFAETTEGEAQPEDKYELWYVDGDKAVLRVIGETEDKTEQYSVELGGRLPIVEMEAEILITEAVRRQQARLNFAESLLTRVAETGGFPERYTLNAEPAGIWLNTKPTSGPALMEKKDGETTWYLHPAPRTLGAAITTDLRGIKKKDGEIAMPGVTFKDPTDPDFAIKSSVHAARCILEQCKQAHVLMNSDAVASGYSREQARADYEDDLTNTKGPLEGLLRDLIEVVIAWAGQMASEHADFLESFRCVVNLQVNSGPISPEEQRQNNENMKAGTLSQKSAMSANGVEDVDAELQSIRDNPRAIVELRQAQADLISLYRGEGMSWENAAIEAGVDEEERLEMFRTMDADEAAAKAQGTAQDDEISNILNGTAAAAGAGAGA